MPKGRSRAASRSLRLFLLPALLAAAARADHPRDFRAALDGLRSNRSAAMEKPFLKDAARPGADRLLALYELGSLCHLAGDLPRSIGYFNGADAVAREYEGAAIISASAAGRTAGALLVNDSVLKYEGYGFEKVLSRTLNSINYLLNGDMEGARVEVRKAEEYQRLERERHQRELQKAQAPPKGAEAARLDNPAVRAQYGRMFDSVRNIRNSYENAFTYYLSGRIFYARGEAGLDDAAVEMRRAFELAPQVPEVRASYLEIARAQGGPILDQAQADLGLGPDGPAPPPAAPGTPEVAVPPVSGPAAMAAAPDPGRGVVVILFETGLVPELDQVKFSLPIDNKLYTLAFPIYPPVGAPQPALAVSGPGFTLTTSRVLDVRAQAVKCLQERLPGILTRGVLGALAKGEVQKNTEKNYGEVAGLFTKLLSAAITNADRRSWLALPAEIQIGQASLPSGRQTLDLVDGPGAPLQVTLDVTPGSTSFVLVRSLPGYRRADARTYPGPAPILPLPPPAAPAAPAPAAAEGSPVPPASL